MALTRRQELCYNHRLDLYRPDYDHAPDAKRLPTSFELAYSAVPCRIEIKPSPTTGSAIGRYEWDISDAIDKIHFAEDQEIDDGWWAVNVTDRPDGTDASFKGRFWVVRGEPQRIIDSTRRRGGKIVVNASQESRGPVGVGD